jgi:hypothetical protein
MRGFKTLALVATASVLLAGSLQAQWTGKFNWVGTNLLPNTSSRYSNSSKGEGTVWNYYTSPYRASFKITSGSSATLLPPPAGSSDFGPTVDIFCVDFWHTAGTGYSAYFTNLANTADLGTKTRSGDQSKYLMAAYLSQQITRVAANSAQAKDMTGAIWQIMSVDGVHSASPLYRNTGGLTSGTTLYTYGGLWSSAGIDYWMNRADLAVRQKEVNAANWVVVTDQRSVGASLGNQEFLTQVTPEPATMLLLGTGLVVMLMAAGALRRPVA